jgi:hypothetical protein
MLSYSSDKLTITVGWQPFTTAPSLKAIPIPMPRGFYEEGWISH